MDDLVRYGPSVLSLVALLLAWSASLAASRACTRADRLERAPGAASPGGASAPDADSPGAKSPDGSPAVIAAMPARTTAFEERLGALEERIGRLSERVAFVSMPDPDDVSPMRPPVPTTVEPLAAPRAGWRMFP